MSSKYTVTLAALDHFSAPFKSFSAVSDKLSTQLKGQQVELRKLSAIQRDMSALDSMKQKLSGTTVELEKAKHAEAALAAEISAAGVPTKKMAADFEKLRLKSATLSAEHLAQTNRLNSLENSLQKAGVDASKFATEQARIENQSKQTTAALKAQQAQLKGLADAQGRIDANRAARADLRGSMLETAALGYVAAQPIAKAIAFESSMADVKKVVNFDDDAEAGKMGKDLLQLSRSIPIAASGLADITAAAGQSGIAKAELLGFTTSAAKMATAFDVSAADAGSTMAAWRASMGLSQEQAVDLADATNHLSNNMNAQAKDIAGVLRRQGAVAMSAGLDQIQAASLSAALLSGGASEEVASTALKNITGAMMKGDTATAAQQSAWADLGFDPSSLAQDMLSDAPGTMIKVFEAMKDVPEEEVSALVSTLFGEEVKGSVMPLLKNLDNLRGAFKLTADATAYKGSMEAEFSARSATSANNLQLLSNKFDRLQISVGTLLLPALNDIIGPVADFADLLADGAEKFPLLAKGIAMVGIGLVALKVGALAVQFVGLTFGQGLNVLNLGRAKMAATTNNTARAASLATAALGRLNNALNRVGRRSRLDTVDPSRRRRAGGRKAPRGGRLGRLAGTAAALGDSLPMGADLLKGAGKIVRPLGVALAAGAAADAFAGDGTYAEKGGAAGNMLGGLGGAAAGAMTGAAIGSVVPVIGTAIGGVLGSIIGGMGGAGAGEWLGDKFGGWFDEPTDKLPPPSVVQKEVSSQHKSQQMVFSPHITMPASSGDKAADERFVDIMMQRLRAEFSTMMGSNQMVVRLDAQLSDRSSS
uniref:Putative tail protein n=1 Tax=viral metagenome TaxID=1070528 RepID=A0A6M3KN98_9ZZZZ